MFVPIFRGSAWLNYGAWIRFGDIRRHMPPIVNSQMREDATQQLIVRV